jgi:saccharopine dehydrogenase-like NADP-dependent oxidoreductase
MKVVFFGTGAVCSVIARVLSQLHEKSSGELKFVFVTRNKSRSKEHLYNAKFLKKHAMILETDSFESIFENPKAYKKYLKHAQLFINSSVPRLNLSIMRLALEFGANYADLASDIYNESLLQTMRFEQESLHDEFVRKGLFALINLGISPGITNFLIGERLYNFNNMPYETTVKKIEINLLEEIHSKQLVFSWSPNVAIEEISSKPLYLKNGNIVAIEPFSKSKTYKFPYYKNFVELYPVFQEELISLKQTFPQVKDIKINVGGSEIELMKNLYQLNLLSNRYCYGYQDSKISINTIIKEVIPKMKSPQTMEEYLQNKIIKYAEFSAVADITLEIAYPQNKKNIKSVESIGVSFNRYLELLDTPFAGATYISYATGVGAAVLIYYTFLASTSHKIQGVLASEKLPPLLGSTLNDIVKRELSAYKINLMNSIK